MKAQLQLWTSVFIVFIRFWAPAVRMWLVTYLSQWAWQDHYTWMGNSSRFPWQQQKAVLLQAPTVAVEPSRWVQKHVNTYTLPWSHLLRPLIFIIILLLEYYYQTSESSKNLKVQLSTHQNSIKKQTSKRSTLSRMILKLPFCVLS